MSRSITAAGPEVVFISLGFRAFLARPCSGEPREAVSASVVDQAADDTEQRALDEERGEQLDEVDLAVLGPRRLLVVDHAPDHVERLPGDLAGQQAGDDADRGERELHRAPPRLVSRPITNPPSSAPSAAVGTGFCLDLTRSCCTADVAPAAGDP